MIFALGDVSGAHLNPAVTLSFALSKRFPWPRVTPYLAAQLTGALSASLVLLLLFPESEYLGSTIPSGEAWQSFIMEWILTFILVLVIFNVSSGSREKGITAAIAVGGVVGLEAMFAGPVSGASMNPFRSLAPAMVSGHTEHIWVYLSAPLGGAVSGMLFHHLLYKKD
jgi:aquaporin Z